MTLVVSLVLACAVQAGAPKPAPPAPPPPNPNLIRVYVDAGGDDDPALKTSVKDLVEAIGDRKKSLASVDDEEKADVTVQVIQRITDTPKVVLGIGTRPGEPPGGAMAQKIGKLQIQVRFGAMQVSLENKNKAYDNPRGWKSAADDLAGQVDKWVGQYRAEILKSRR
jgi:hypothetical protein